MEYLLQAMEAHSSHTAFQGLHNYLKQYRLPLQNGPAKELPNPNEINPLFNRLPHEIAFSEVIRSYQSDLVRSFAGRNQEPSPPRLLYVPTLRGFRSPKETPNYFSTRTVQDYFYGSKFETIPVFCGGDMYTRLKTLLLGKKENRKLVARFEKFLSEQFFEGKTVNLIPHEDEKRIYVALENEKEQPISEIGDGLQHLITILFPVFERNEPVVQVVEEPELFLHPGFQTKLLDCYLKPQFEHVQFFATTHSNHLINLTLDKESVAVFRVSKTIDSTKEDQLPTFKVQFIDDQDREVLSDLGVQRASLLLSNCVILVEGPTDRRYFQRFIELYAEKFNRPKPIMDLHYSFLEYGGTNLSSYNFFAKREKVDPTRLVGSEFVLTADVDKSPKKAELRKWLKETLKEKFITFNAVEVENLLHPEVVRSIVKSYEGNDCKALDSVNWNDYALKRLGSFIEEGLRHASWESKRRSTSGHPYAACPSNPKSKTKIFDCTLKDKSSFCDRALRFLDSHLKMTDEALRFAKELFDFVARSNPTVNFSNQGTTVERYD